MVFDRMIRDLISAGANIEDDGSLDHDKLTVEFVKSRLMDEANK